VRALRAFPRVHVPGVRSLLPAWVAIVQIRKCPRGDARADAISDSAASILDKKPTSQTTVVVSNGRTYTTRQEAEGWSLRPLICGSGDVVAVFSPPWKSRFPATETAVGRDSVRMWLRALQPARQGLPHERYLSLSQVSPCSRAPTKSLNDAAARAGAALFSA
jgi:hypothetical protein